MPAKSSAVKRMRSDAKKAMRNKMIKSEVKTVVKKFLQTISDKNADSAKSELQEVFKKIDKAGKHGVFHKNTVNRKKSRLAKQVLSVSAQSK